MMVMNIYIFFLNNEYILMLRNMHASID